MIIYHKLMASALGIGYIKKGAGTVAAIAVCILFICFRHSFIQYRLLPVLITLLVLVLGTWSAGKCEHIWGKDNNRIVIDEVLGMCISLLYVPLTVRSVVIAFVLFRILDICKPLLIRNAEQLGGGMGVMADDLLAGIYTNIFLHLIEWWSER
jgi:phosphatidylglycerophosphatase A